MTTGNFGTSWNLAELGLRAFHRFLLGQVMGQAPGMVATEGEKFSMRSGAFHQEIGPISHSFGRGLGRRLMEWRSYIAG